MTARNTSPFSGFTWRVAARELRGGLGGFRIFLACLALGVAAIAGVGSLSQAFVTGLAEEGQSLLGGDVEIEITHRPATDEELAWMEARGTVSRIATMRAMAFAVENEARRLVSLKAVDGRHPLYGVVETLPPMEIQDALAAQDGAYGAAVEPSLLGRLGLEVGDTLRIGTKEFTIRAAIDKEPDTVAAGFRFGPRVLIPLAALPETGLVQQGSLIEYNYRIALPAPVSNADVNRFIDEARDTFPDSDWQLRSRMRAQGGARNAVRQVSVFLTLVGLTALVVGGVGVGNAVRSYLDRKRGVIATLKCLGATGGQVFAIYMMQVMAIASLGIAIGLVLGVLTPFGVAALYGDALPIPAKFGVYPQALGLAAVYGFLVAFAFTVWPLARAREIPAAGLFRDLVAKSRTAPRAVYQAMVVVSLAVLAVLSVYFTENRIFAAFFITGTAGVFVILWLTASFLAWAAQRAGRPRRPGLRMALANLYRPGAATGSIVLSLGLGLTLLVTVSLIDGNITRQMRDQIPDQAPAFFFLDIQKSQVEEFDRLVWSVDGVSELNRVPYLRGRITRVKGVPAEEAEAADSGRWALRGDRGLTYSTALPVNSVLASGEWWPEDYDGPQLVSVEKDIADGLFLSIGDTLTFNVLGREIQATLASTRELQWDSYGLNFNFVFSPGLLAGAPFTHVATVTARRDAEDELERIVTDAFPNVSAVRVREALETLNGLINDLAQAIRGTTGVTLFAGILVLAGAMAAGYRQRNYDAAVLKVLGATRWRVMSAYILEFAILGAATSVIASGAGTLAAYLVITQVMNATWSFLPGTLLLTIVTSVVVTVVFGLAGTYRILGQKAAPVLRAE